MILIQVQLDKEYIDQEFKKQLAIKLDELQSEEVFWDMKTLCEKTKMSVNTVKDTFFYNSDFPKKKVGQKWYFPAGETKQFLINWLKER